MQIILYKSLLFPTLSTALYFTLTLHQNIEALVHQINRHNLPVHIPVLIRSWNMNTVVGPLHHGIHYVHAAKVHILSFFLENDGFFCLHTSVYGMQLNKTVFAFSLCYIFLKWHSEFVDLLSFSYAAVTGVLIFEFWTTARSFKEKRCLRLELQSDVLVMKQLKWLQGERERDRRLLRLYHDSAQSWLRLEDEETRAGSHMTQKQKESRIGPGCHCCRTCPAHGHRSPSVSWIPAICLWHFKMELHF